MATQDFGLSYTVSAPALWNDFQEGYHGAASTIFFYVPTLDDKMGAAGTLFFNQLVLDSHGAASSIEGAEFCLPRNILGGGGPISMLSEPGGPNVLSCD